MVMMQYATGLGMDEATCRAEADMGKACGKSRS